MNNTVRVFEYKLYVGSTSILEPVTMLWDRQGEVEDATKRSRLIFIFSWNEVFSKRRFPVVICLFSSSWVVFVFGTAPLCATQIYLAVFNFLVPRTRAFCAIKLHNYCNFGYLKIYVCIQVNIFSLLYT